MLYDLYSWLLYFYVGICKRCNRQLAEFVTDFSVESSFGKTPRLEEPPSASVESEVISLIET